MRICFLTSEIFAYGVYGGFGALTRKIAMELSRRGIEVYVIMPRRSPAQKPVETMDGFTVVSYPPEKLWFYKYRTLYKLVDADIYHSEEPIIETYVAQKVMPKRKHVITFQDPRTIEDMRVEWRYEYYKTEYVKMELKARIIHQLIKSAVKRADALYCQAWYAIPKAMKLYGLRKPPEFLPNPVDIPRREIKKSDEPTVCFLARWDQRKRPEYFFELAKSFPNVKFVAMGKASPQFAKRDKFLREKYGKIPNIIMTGFVSEEEKSVILEKSWILVNTSWRECLPVSYLEACAHKCAILSHENPDNFAKNFGYHANIGSLKDFERGLKWLLEKDRWKSLGEKGYKYVKEIHETNKVINKHIEIYKKLSQ